MRVSYSFTSSGAIQDRVGPSINLEQPVVSQSSILSLNYIYQFKSLAAAIICFAKRKRAFFVPS